MIKYINGTWFEFQHASICEGLYWNESCKEFTEKQWEAKIKEIHETGMDYLVLMSTALNEEAYFTTDIFRKAPLNCTNPVEVVLRTCDKYGIKVFIGAGFYGNWTRTLENMTKQEIINKTLRAMNQLAEQYAHHKSFFGWYLPDETFIDKHFRPEFINYVNVLGREGKTLTPHGKILIAPFGTRVVIPDDEFVRQLEGLEADIIAYQDEIGVRKTRVEESTAFYEGLYKAHEKAGRAELWADVEVFEFEGDVYKSALLPAPFERIKKQLEAVSPFVKNILIYQYEGMMNKPDSEAFAGSKNSTKLYSEYMAWMKENYHNVLRKE